MTERAEQPAVALTDLAVGVEASAFAVILFRRAPRYAIDPRTREVHRWLVVSFASTGIAALAGAAIHGLFADRTDPRRRRLWRLSMGAIDVGGLTAWRIGSALALSEPRRRVVADISTTVHGAYLAILSRSDPPFSVAIATYLPGALFLTAALLGRLPSAAGRKAAAVAAVGMGLTFGAAIVQLRGIAIHPRLFDRNATYHSVQAVAVACFFAAADGLIRSVAGAPSDRDDQAVARR